MKITEIFKKLKNETVTVELKTGVSLQGILFEMDKNMNLHLKNVKRKMKKEDTIFISEISVRGSSVRYIILPIWLNMENVLSIGL